VEYALRDSFEQILINPHLLKEKRKTDVKDSKTIAYVVLTGLFKPNFVIPEIQRQLKTLNRRLIKVTQRRTAESSALGTTLTNYNVLLANEIQLLSKSGQQILQAIAQGEKDPQTAAQQAIFYLKGRNANLHKEKFQAIVNSLQDLPLLPDTVRTTIRFLLEEALFSDYKAKQYRTEFRSLLKHYQITLPTGRILTATEALEILKSIDGVSDRYAETFLAEMGLDMQRFPTPDHAVSYGGFNPEKRVSADKVVSTQTPPGNKYLHTVTIQIAQAMLQTSKSDNPLVRWAREYRSRNGGSAAAHNMAVAALGRRIVYISWILLSKGEKYNPQGYRFDARCQDTAKKIDKLSRQVSDVKALVQAKDLDEVARVRVLEMIHTMGSMIGMDTSLRIVPDKEDGSIQDLALSTRTRNVLLKAGIDKVSGLVFRWTTQTLMKIPKFGESSYKEVVTCLFEKGFLIKTKD
jgi:transposase